MSCHQCTKKLPSRVQQQYCPICKFIMCRKCLCNTFPSNKDKGSKICLQCYERVTKNLPDADPREFDPPIFFLKRMEELKNKPPHQPTQRSPKKAETDDIKKLAERSNALTTDKPGSIPTEAELQIRLDTLSNFLLARKINNNADETPKPKTDEDSVKNIIDQVQDEARLATKYGLLLNENKDSLPERTYCSLCANAATVLCPACMDEEFCNHCFLRAHKPKHMKHHESVPITQ